FNWLVPHFENFSGPFHVLCISVSSTLLFICRCKMKLTLFHNSEEISMRCWRQHNGRREWGQSMCLGKSQQTDDCKR
ncbi:hypothetical protein C0J52_14634, partial [Blattella germanica]